MKRHLLGLTLFILVLSLSFLLAPIRFQSTWVGQTNVGRFTSYRSTDFVNACSLYEEAEDVSEARKRFETYLAPSPDSPERELIVSERSADRGVVNLTDSNFGNAYCVYRLEGTWILSFCSVSLKHGLELERQTMSRQLK